jgi:hypothetical protein
MFDSNQARAVVAFLQWKRENTDSDVSNINAAIVFWQSRIAELEGDAAHPGVSPGGASPRG